MLRDGGAGVRTWRGRRFLCTAALLKMFHSKGNRRETAQLVRRVNLRASLQTGETC